MPAPAAEAAAGRRGEPMRGEKEALVPNKAATSAARRSMPAGMRDTASLALDVLERTNWAVGTRGATLNQSTVATKKFECARIRFYLLSFEGQSRGRGGDAGQRREGVQDAAPGRKHPATPRALLGCQVQAPTEWHLRARCLFLTARGFACFECLECLVLRKSSCSECLLPMPANAQHTHTHTHTHAHTHTHTHTQDAQKRSFDRRARGSLSTARVFPGRHSQSWASMSESNPSPPGIHGRRCVLCVCVCVCVYINFNWVCSLFLFLALLLLFHACICACECVCVYVCVRM
jgi:hypothetical protein